MPSSLGPAEIMVILVVALILLGPNRLPDAGRQVGKAISEVRRWTNEAKREMRSVIGTDALSPGTLLRPPNETRTSDPGVKAQPER